MRYKPEFDKFRSFEKADKPLSQFPHMCSSVHSPIPAVFLGLPERASWEGGLGGVNGESPCVSVSPFFFLSFVLRCHM